MCKPSFAKATAGKNVVNVFKVLEVFLLTTFIPLSTFTSLFPVSSVTTEITRRRKFSKFVAHHVFGHKYRHKGFSIVYGDGFANHCWDNHRRAAPSFNHLFAVALLCFFYLFQQRVMDVRAFFK